MQDVKKEDCFSYSGPRLDLQGDCAVGRPVGSVHGPGEGLLLQLYVVLAQTVLCSLDVQINLPTSQTLNQIVILLCCLGEDLSPFYTALLDVPSKPNIPQVSLL